MPNPIDTARIDSRIQHPPKKFLTSRLFDLFPKKTIQLNVIVLQKKTSHPDIIFYAQNFLLDLLKKHLGKPFLSFGGSLWFTNRQMSSGQFFEHFHNPTLKNPQGMNFDSIL